MDVSHMADAPNWLKLDNTANVYPAVRRRNWASQFRLSATLTEEVNPVILQWAVYRATSRFPAFSMQLKRGLFWHFLRRIEGGPPVRPDGCCPCEPLRPEDNGDFYFRVSYYEKRISVDFFHALTDGTGALSYFKTMLAEYLTSAYGIKVPRDGVILDCDEQSEPEEYEDSFQKYAGGLTRVLTPHAAFRIRGEREPDGFINATMGIIPVDEVLERAKACGASLTQYLATIMMLSIQSIQRREIPNNKRRAPVNLLIPINLRAFFPSYTTRNFTGIVTPSIDTRLGEYSFEEVLNVVKSHMSTEITRRNLRARFTAFVKSQRNPILRAVPLILKTPALRLAHRLTGERMSCTTMTNVGRCDVPPEMEGYIDRMELIMGPLRENPVVCSLMSYRGTLYISMARSIKEPKLEREFFRRLVRLGISVKIESNRRR